VTETDVGIGRAVLGPYDNLGNDMLGPPSGLIVMGPVFLSGSTSVLVALVSPDSMGLGTVTF
jgi:hypothetical protein